MSSRDDLRLASGPGAEVTSRLGYLLKHAQLQLGELTSAALAPYGLSGRELAVLLSLAGGEPASQQEAAQRLGVDRTTMVALLDALEAKGLVTRHPHAGDRRRNVVELTPAGAIARAALGSAGAGPVPSRAPAAEHMLTGQPANMEIFRAAL